jgi:predicted MFS family arabinose efflux permease
MDQRNEPELARLVPKPSEGLPLSGVLAVAFAGFATFLDLYATQPLLPHLAAEFQASKAAVGLTVSAPTAAVALLAPLVGVFGDQLNRKRTIVASITALAVVTCLAATAHRLRALVLWRFLQGAAVPGVYVMALSYLAEEAGAASIGRAMAAFVTGNVVGGFAGRAIAGLVGKRLGWPTAFVILGVLNAVGAVVTWRLLPPSRNFTRHEERPLGIGHRLRSLTTPRLLATYAIGFNVLFSLVASFSYVVFYLSSPPFALTADGLSAIFSVYLVGAFITPVVGPWIDRAGARNVILFALGGGALGMGLTLLHMTAAVVAGLALACSSAFVCQSASTSQLREAAPAGLRSLASGAYVTVYYLGGSAGGVIPGLLWNRFHWGGCVALVIAVEGLTMALAWRFWRERSRGPLSSAR